MHVGKIDRIVCDVLPTVIYDSGELGAAVTTIRIDSTTGYNINGDNDGEYEIICRFIGGNAIASQYSMTLNNDTTSDHYGRQEMYGTSATVAADYFNTGHNPLNKMLLDSASTDQNKVMMCHAILHAKSGYIRTMVGNNLVNTSGTTVSYVQKFGNVWNSSANITRIDFATSQTNGIGIGSRIIILRRNTSTTGIRAGTLNIQGKVTGAWQRIYSNTLTVATQTITISGLNGNSDAIYKLISRVVHGNATDEGFKLQFNGDSGVNYGTQLLYGIATSATAQTLTTAYIPFGAAITAGSLSMQEAIIYSVSGKVRTVIQEFAENIKTTTVTTIGIGGCSWNNTVDNLTSVVLTASNVDAFGIGTGTELYRLNL